VNEIIYLKIRDSIEIFKQKAIRLLQDLIRIPSVNQPPNGDEKAVQEFYSTWLNRHEINSSVIFPDRIIDFINHPARLLEHSMYERPIVIASLKGSGDGRSLLLVSHADTESVGERSKWIEDPFSGVELNGKIYGLGSGDDKCGMTIAAMVPLILRRAGIELSGDLVIASVADEESGGGNGTAALLASKVVADAAVYLDGSNQAIWNVGLGGGCVNLTIEPEVNIDFSNRIEKIKKKIIGIKSEIKQRVILDPDFGLNFFENDLQYGFYSIRQRQLDDKRIQLSFFLDTLPGDDDISLQRHVETELGTMGSIKINWMSRFLKPAKKLNDNHPLIVTLSSSFTQATGRKAMIGPGRQSDQGLIDYFGKIPCVLFGCGRRGKDGAPHQENEYVLLDEFLENLLTVTLFAAHWCGMRQK